MTEAPKGTEPQTRSRAGGIDCFVPHFPVSVGRGVDLARDDLFQYRGTRLIRPIDLGVDEDLSDAQEIASAVGRCPGVAPSDSHRRRTRCQRECRRFESPHPLLTLGPVERVCGSESFGASFDVPLRGQRYSARPIASIQEFSRGDAGRNRRVAGAIRGFVAPYMGSRRHTRDAVAPRYQEMSQVVMAKLARSLRGWLKEPDGRSV